MRKLFLLFLILSIICITAYESHGAIDPYEPDNNESEAKTQAMNTTSSAHSIDPADDQDWISFVITEVTDIIIETSGPSGDTRMWLYDNSLNGIADDDDGGDSTFSRIEQTLSPGTYYVKIDEYSNDDIIMEYYIHLTEVMPPSPDSYEPDNSEAEATVQAMNTTSSAHSIVPADDHDWISFVITEVTDIIIETTGPSGNTRMWLYDSALNEIDYDNFGGEGSFSRIEQVLSPGTYYVEIDEYSNDDIIMEYYIHLSGLFPDSYEPDNSNTEATVQSMNSTAAPEHNIYPADDQDWITFDVSTATGVRIETTGSSGDTEMWLYDNALSEITYDDDNGVDSFSKIEQNLYPGTYYVKIDEYQNDEVIPEYSILLMETVALGDSFEIDNSAAEATLQAVNTTSPAHSIDPADDQDWITFVFEESGRVIIETTSPDPFDNTRMWLYDSALSEIAYDDDSGYNWLSMIERTLSPGTYYVRIDEKDNNKIIPEYYIHLSGVFTDSYEPDNSNTEATVQSMNSTAPEHTIYPEDDQDWITFNVSTATGVRIETTGPSGDTEMWLYDNSLNEIDYDDNGGDGTFSKIEQNLYPGTYYVKIDEDGNNAVIPEYSILLMETAVLGDSFEIDNSAAEATLQAVNTTSPAHSFDPAGDQDWIYFVLDEPGLVIIETSGPDDGTKMWLYDSALNEIAYDNFGGDGFFSRIEQNLLAGTYYVKIIGLFDSSVTPEYYITLTQYPPIRDSYEPDNSAAEATLQAVNTTSLQRSIDPLDDHDWISFILEESRTIIIETSGPGGDTRMWLYDNALNEIAYNDDDRGYGSFSKIERILSPGRYYVEIDEYENNDIISEYYINLQATDVIEIWTLEQLQNIDANSTTLSYGYRLMCDIDASATSAWNNATGIAMGFNPIGAENNTFTGVFDGQGFVIRNLYINRPDENYVGLFAWSFGTVYNVVLENADVSGNAIVGAVMGYNTGFITNSHSNATVNGDYNVGGLVGLSYGTITNSYSTGIVVGAERTGGLAGSNRWGSTVKIRIITSGSTTSSMTGYAYGFVTNSYSNCAVSGSTGVGGLVGWNLNDITNCYSTGSVIGVTDAGGLVGYNNDFAGDITNSFWDIETSWMTISAGGTGKTTAEMKAKTTFTDAGWDFISVWDIINGQTYPFFIGEAIPCGNDAIEGDEVCDGSDLGNEDCISQGYDDGTLSCLGDCSGFDFSECIVGECGNDSIEGAEVCDGGDLGGETCESRGYSGGGVLSCLPDCSGFDFSKCIVGECGNDFIEGAEVCDGGDLGGETCESHGYSGGGVLSCLPDCSGFDFSECIVGDLDGDGVLDDLDNCPDTPNGPDGGTCTEGDTENLCMNNEDCDFELIEGVCSMDQEDSDSDETGDVCDNCLYVDNEDQANDDGDNLGNACDNCWYVDNPDQADDDGNCTDPMPYTSDPSCGDACAHPTLSFGEWCGTSSGCIPITLTNALGIDVFSILCDVGYDPDDLLPLDCLLGPAGEAAGKEISTCDCSMPGTCTIEINSGGGVVGDGIVAYADFEILAACGSETTLTLDCTAQDPQGGDITVTSEGGVVKVVRVGDLDCNGQVAINEIIKVIRMYLGQDPVDPIADPGCDGEVQIFDVIKAINCYLETEACLCEV